MKWHIAAQAHYARQVHVAKGCLQKQKRNRKDSCYTGNLNLRKRDLERAQIGERAAIQQTEQFAAAHDIPITPIEIRNAGTLQGHVTRQLTLL
jgi:hypothetical protein